MRPGVTAGTEFEFYGGTYWYENVTGVNGLIDGEMNVKVFKRMSETISAFNAAGEATSFDMEVILRMGLCNGMNMSGDVFTYWGGGYEQVGTCKHLQTETRVGNPIDFYLQPDQMKWLKETAVTKNDLGTFDFEKTYTKMGSSTNMGGSYALSRLNYTGWITAKGGGIGQGESYYIYDENYWSNVINQRVRIAARFRGASANGTCSPRTLAAVYVASNANRNNAGSDQTDIIYSDKHTIHALERQISIRQSVCSIKWMRYVTVLLYCFFCPACGCDIYMKRISNISCNLSVEDMRKAAKRAFVGHNGKGEVRNFKNDFEENCDFLYDCLMNGEWTNLLEYRQLTKVNRNGKVRQIDSPSLNTRIYQHLLLNLLEPIYYSKDNGNAVNCKRGCGITSKVKKNSIVHALKHVYYDRLDLNYCLIIDQRECYKHVTVKKFRKMLKRMIDDKWLVDFAVKVTFVNGRLPIGTPTSPFVHHVLMLSFDYFVKRIAPFAIRYADDNFLAFHTKEDAQAAKWRIKNYWWYELGMRAKRGTVVIKPMDMPCDFCGYIFHRNNKGINEHNKGYVTLRRRTVRNSLLCNNDKSWAAYFGLFKHADAYSLMRKIEEKMKLRNLTDKIKIDRQMDAPNRDIRSLVGMSIDIYDYEIRRNNQGQPNWIKCLVGVPEIDNDGEPTGNILAHEFHGNYQGIIQFIVACEQKYSKKTILPLEDVEIENQCGYIFKGSTNQLIYIQNEKD